jgi:hypothetical protein
VSGDPSAAKEHVQSARWKGQVARATARSLTRPSLRSCCSSSDAVDHGRICEFWRSSGGFEGRLFDHPPCPTRGSSGRRCSQARQTSEMVPARPPMTMQASPDSAMSRLRASPIPHGTTTVAGQSGGGISSGGTMLKTNPPAATARSAATRVAGLPQPLTTVIPSEASRVPRLRGALVGRRAGFSATKDTNLRTADRGGHGFDDTT